MSSSVGPVVCRDGEVGVVRTNDIVEGPATFTRRLDRPILLAVLVWNFNSSRMFGQGQATRCFPTMIERDKSTWIEYDRLLLFGFHQESLRQLPFSVELFFQLERAAKKKDVRQLTAGEGMIPNPSCVLFFLLALPLVLGIQ